MKICKSCGSEFNSSGSFCSKRCQGKYASTFVKNHKCNFKNKHAPFGRWTCTKCGQIFETRTKMFEHTRTHRLNPDKKEAWNKGLTKETDPRIMKGVETFSKKYKEGLITPSFLGKHFTEEQRKKISDSMKKAHAEGRAHNIGQSRWNNEPSYPEKFFIKVIENEFENKNYQREFPFFKYSLDFAWVNEKKVLEIDGEQHERFNEYKERDKKKDELLLKNGWKVLRIKWKDVMKETKYWIKVAKSFIDS